MGELPPHLLAPRHDAWRRGGRVVVEGYYIHENKYINFLKKLQTTYALKVPVTESLIELLVWGQLHNWELNE